MPHGFELVWERDIAELKTRARMYHHAKTGAELVSLENDDENKVFGVSFRTPPPDSTGLPHIMEHAVLCGSRKFPVREPFVELMKGSLNTFLNALTGADQTSYPVASQNVKDLYNLVDVYLDAVFHPRLTPHVLRQEGWHLELENLDAPLAFKGVVFNEMKGAYSSPDALLHRHSQRSLFPDTPYGLDAGGDPAEIPNLTFEQFKAFHEKYYHPSNARIWFYGDDDPDERLRFLHIYLRDFDRAEVDSSIALQARFDRPRRLEIRFDASENGHDGGGEGEDGGEGDGEYEYEDEDEAQAGGKAQAGGGTDGRKGMLTVNWMLAEHGDPETALGLDILDHILVGTSAAPLRKALIDSGLGEDMAGGGLDDGLRQTCFSAGLKGIDVSDADAVEALVVDTLARLAADGLDPDTVAASMNTVEFVLRENNTGRFPRGLSLMFRALSTWLHDGDPLAPLEFDAQMAAIRARLTGGERYFEGLIRDYLVDNTHRTTVVLRPDPHVREEQEALEQARLAEARAVMSDDELGAVIDATRELKRLQETPDPPEALATIPSLTLADLDREGQRLPLEFLRDDRILYHDLFTNGIVYLDLGFDLHALPQDLVPYVPLFGQALVKMGTETQDFVKLSQRVGSKTGGVGPSLFTASVRDETRSAARLFLRGKATPAQTDDLLAILRDVLLTVKLDDRGRFRQLVLESKARTETGLVPGGHMVVGTRLGAKFNEAGWLAEQLGGVSALFFLRRLADDVENNWPAVLDKLESVRRILVNRAAMICNVTLDRDNWQVFEPKLADFVDALPAPATAAATWSPAPPASFEGLTIPARVNYVAKGTNLYERGYQLHGSVAVITNYLRTTWLWERVRVQGGAYGGFCMFDRHSGLFSYLSYRDPNLLATIDNFDATSRFLRDLDLRDDELEKSIIGAIGAIDDHLLPDAKGYASMARHLTHETDERRQRFREEVLATTQADFRAFADVLEQVNTHGRVVVMGSEEAIARANAERGGWLAVTKVL